MIPTFKMNILEVNTGYSSIFKFENILNSDICDSLTNLIKSKISSYHVIKKMPWNDGDDIHPFKIENDYLREQIYNYRNNLADILSEKYKLRLYPEFTHLVLWRAGRFMRRHRDDGYGTPEGERIHGVKKVSTVTYLNSNYVGGDTFIGNESGIDYISKPKKGSVVSFLSNGTNMHGVTEVLEGVRVTLPIWFCSDVNHSENSKLSKDFKYYD